MNETDEKAIEQMKLALASCAGPVTRCPPGRARAPAEAVVVRSASVQWLRKNQDARPIRDTKAARRQMRVAPAEQQRVAKCNAPLLKRINKQERNARARENERVAARTPLRRDGVRILRQPRLGSVAMVQITRAARHAFPKWDVNRTFSRRRRTDAVDLLRHWGPSHPPVPAGNQPLPAC
jgi:hypothetical protein